MFEEFYGLRRSPFHTTPDPEFLFLANTHREALACLEYGIGRGLGIIMLTGEVGVGKTTILRAFLERQDLADLTPIYVFHPQLSFAELIQLIADELGLGAPDGKQFDAVRQIQEELIERYTQGKRVVVIVDEAHRLPEATLEGLRLLSNLEAAKAKLLQIVLVGQPELEALLARSELRQLEQRIEIKARLQALDDKEAREYVRNRLTLAGSEKPGSVMTAGAIAELARLAQGIPRRMNILANLALVEGFGKGERPITRRTVAASAKLHAKPARARRHVWLKRAAVTAVAASALAAIVAGTVELPVDYASLQRFLTEAAKTIELKISERNWPLREASNSQRQPGTASQPATMPQLGARRVRRSQPVTTSQPGTTSQPVTTSQPDMTFDSAASSRVVASAAVPQSPAAAEPQPVPAGTLPVAPVQERPEPAVVQATADRSNVTRLPDDTGRVPVAKPSDPAAMPKIAHAPGALPPAAVSTIGNGEIEYLVVPGDTLWTVSMKMLGDAGNQMITRISERNGIVDPRKLLAGQTIYLPGPGTR